MKDLAVTSHHHAQAAFVRTQWRFNWPNKPPWKQSAEDQGGI